MSPVRTAPVTCPDGDVTTRAWRSRGGAIPGVERNCLAIRCSSSVLLLTLLLGNLEHLINHKHQLFVYLKMMGMNVKTSDLYCSRASDEC